MDENAVLDDGGGRRPNRVTAGTKALARRTMVADDNMARNDMIQPLPNFIVLC